MVRLTASRSATPARTWTCCADASGNWTATSLASSLLTSIEGIGTNTAARLITELGDLSRFPNAAALAAYVGVVPGLKQSGKRRGQRAGLCPIGHARLRAALWMPLLGAVRRNPWLKAFYDRLISRGKLPKVALIAALRKLLGAVFAVVFQTPPSRSFRAAREW